MEIGNNIETEDDEEEELSLPPLSETTTPEYYTQDNLARLAIKASVLRYIQPQVIEL